MFAIGELVVYPAHGVGRITAIEPLATIPDTLFYVIVFDRDQLTLRLPTDRTGGLRTIASRAELSAVLTALTRQRTKIKGVWHQLETSYRHDLTSGNLITIATLARNLFVIDQEHQSHSQRLFYEAAIDRLTDEIMAITKWDRTRTAALLEEALTTKKLPQELNELR